MDREKPGDVYTHVSNMVARKIKTYVSNSKDSNHDIAKKLDEKVKRKIVKQTVPSSRRSWRACMGSPSSAPKTKSNVKWKIIN